MRDMTRVRYGTVLVLLFVIVESDVTASSSSDGWITSVTGELDSNASAVVGREVQLPCDITPPTPDDRTHLVLWYKQDSGNPIYTKDMRSNQSMAPAVQLTKEDIRLRVSFHQGTHLASPYLLVKDVMADDQGLYRCRVDFKRARSRNSHVHLNVIVPPQVPSILDEKGLDLGSRIGPYNEGSSLFLSCEVVGGHPPSRVTWWRNGTLLDQSYEVTSLAIVRNDLMVRSLTRSDFQAVFTCRASNNNQTEPVVSSATLDMNLKPLEVVISHTKDVALKAGKQYKILCHTSGSRPTPIMSWWKDGTQLKRSEESVSPDKNMTTSTLTFTPTAEDHEKSLSCKTENPVIPNSQVDDTLTLKVQYSPVVSLNPGESIRLSSVREGDDVYLECGIRANPWVLRVGWRFQGKALLSSEGVLINNQSLVLQKVKRAHTGTYTCVATNTEGEGESPPIRLQVKYPPMCVQGPKSVLRVARHEVVRIQCKVEAFPTNVKFYWKSNQSSEVGEEIFSQNFVEERTTVTSTLTLTPHKEKDFGNYYCWASNDVGHQKIPCIFTLELAGPPDPVNNCSVINQTQTVINVSCKSGYDGGLPQTFICDVSESNNNESKRSLTSSAPSCLVDNLYPGVNYVISIYASNHKGRSRPHSLTTNTLKSELSDATVLEKFTTILGVIIGVVIALVFIAITILLVMKVKTSGRARLKNCQTSENIDKSSNHQMKTIDECLETEEKSPDIICNTNEQDFPNVKIRCMENRVDEPGIQCGNSSLRHPKLSTFTGYHNADNPPLGTIGRGGGIVAGCSYSMRKIQPIEDFRPPDIQELQPHRLVLENENWNQRFSHTRV